MRTPITLYRLGIRLPDLTEEKAEKAQLLKDISKLFRKSGARPITPEQFDIAWDAPMKKLKQAKSNVEQQLVRVGILSPEQVK